ncbi:MAG TPA: bifunctional nuclease domain-containing protein [Labilithrix sp.]
MTTFSLLAALFACGRPPEPAVVPMALPITTPAVAPPTPAQPLPVTPSAPDGYVEVSVGDVTESGGGAAVELVEPQSHRVVTMMIGGTEGHSILLRKHGSAPPRPLTHDLFDAALHELHAEVLQVQVDTLEAGVFHGTVVLVQDERVIPLDARPSDAIALALGAKAPIYMARAVLDRAGEDRN